jgi:hypothetical protein
MEDEIYIGGRLVDEKYMNELARNAEEKDLDFSECSQWDYRDHISHEDWVQSIRSKHLVHV